MIGRRRHVDDEQLFTSYLAQRCGEQVDPRVGEHLADCSGCGARYGELVRFMTGLRNEADREFEVEFPPDYLRRQQEQIARRLEHVGHPARVLSFPGRSGERSSGARGGQVAPRWIAAAAAAGLLVGAAVGTWYNASSRHGLDLGLAGRAADSAPADPAATVTARATPIAQMRVLDDDTFLSELESATDGPRCRELKTFDLLTPAVQDLQASLVSY